MAQFISKPQKSLGQNFLWDRNIAKKIIEALKPQDDDVILEIGPGRGILTEVLMDSRISFYIGIEIDRNLVELLERKIKEKSLGNFLILHQDFLDFSIEEFEQIRNKKIKVLGNIPYHLTSSILFKILDNREYITTCVLMLQKEVAERIVSPPASKNYGILSVLLQLFADVNHLFDVSPNCFVPKPKVESSVIKISPKRNLFYEDKYEFLKKVVKKAFNQRRKKLLNSLFKHFEIEPSDLKKPEISALVNLRAEQLEPIQFVAICDYLVSLGKINGSKSSRGNRV
jgi:16S rRNA (adenine1518-N6/adenine1519-N6)-dimethyltransferase